MRALPALLCVLGAAACDLPAAQAPREVRAQAVPSVVSLGVPTDVVVGVSEPLFRAEAVAEVMIILQYPGLLVFGFIGQPSGQDVLTDVTVVDDRTLHLRLHLRPPLVAGPFALQVTGLLPGEGPFRVIDGASIEMELR